MNRYHNESELMTLIDKSLIKTKRNVFVRLILKQEMTEAFFGRPQRKLRGEQVFDKYENLKYHSDYPRIQKNIKCQLTKLEIQREKRLASKLLFVNERMTFLAAVLRNFLE
jgi:hypothetical protein